MGVDAAEHSMIHEQDEPEAAPKALPVNKVHQRALALGRKQIELSRRSISRLPSRTWWVISKEEGSGLAGEHGLVLMTPCPVHPRKRTKIPEIPCPREARGDLVHLQQTERLRRAHRRLTKQSIRVIKREAQRLLEEGNAGEAWVSRLGKKACG